MKSLIGKYKIVFQNRSFLVSLGAGLTLFTASLVVNFYAGQYALEKASNAVTDLIISNIRVFNVEGIFIYGPIIFWFFIILFCLSDPKKIPFTLKAVAIFIFIRSLFIVLTHIAPCPTQAAIADPNFVEKFISGSGGDLFFSSHTGMPFLMALIFWQQKYIRFISLAAAILFGAVVLLGHFHYSIDVLAAFFITFTIYHIALKLFVKDRVLFLSSEQTNL